MGINNRNRQRAREFDYNTKTGKLDIRDASTGFFTPGGR